MPCFVYEWLPEEHYKKYLKACKGDCQSGFELGKYLAEHRNTNLAHQWFFNCACGSDVGHPNGSPDAMYALAKQYASGIGATFDDGCTNYWFTRAAEKGHVGAIEELERRAAKKAQAQQQP